MIQKSSVWRRNLLLVKIPSNCWNDNKHLGYHINFVDKAAAVLRRMTPSSERRSTMSKMLSNSIAWYREIVHERKSQLRQQTSLLSDFKKFPQPSQPSATTILIHQQPSALRQGPPPAKALWSAEGSDPGEYFLALKYF